MQCNCNAVLAEVKASSGMFLNLHVYIHGWVEWFDPKFTKLFPTASST